MLNNNHTKNLSVLKSAIFFLRGIKRNETSRVFNMYILQSIENVLKRFKIVFKRI